MNARRLCLGLALALFSARAGAQQDPPPPEALAPAPEALAPAPAVVPPRLLEEVRPDYPERAHAERVAASVTLELDIDVNGAVTRTALAVPADPAGYGFDEAALAAGAKLRFEPAQLEGKPVAVRIRYQFHFVPEPVAPPPAEVSAPAPPPPPAPVVAQRTGELSGTLAERGTRAPLAGVKVTVFRGAGADAVGFETETDSEGHFRFSGLGAGQWQILAEPEGFYPVRERETVTEGQRLDVRYLIERGSYNPYDVLVDAKRVRREVTRHSIDTKQADRVPGTFGDVLAVVKNFPGVARTPVVGQEGVVIRGSAPEDSKQFIDGIQIPQIYHFGGLRSVLTVGMTDHIDFYPGNFSAQYGRATGGITDVGLAPLKLDAFHGYADVSLFDTSLYLEAPITDELSLAVGGRRSYIDFVLDQVLPNTGGTIAPRYYDAQALIRYRPSSAHQLSGFFMISDDAFRIVFDEPIDGNAETVVDRVGFFSSFYRGLAEYRYVPSPRLENKLQLSYGRDHFNINVGEFAIDVHTGTGQARETFRYGFSDAVALTVGGDYLYERVEGKGTLPQLPREGDPVEEPDLGQSTVVDLAGTYHSTAAFAELELAPFAGTLILPSVRAEHFSRTGELAVQPRLSLRQRLTQAFTLKGGVGHYVQEPEFLETDAAVGNPDLGLKQAIHYSAGVEYRPLPHLSFDVTAFYKTLFNQVSRTDAVVERNGELVPANLDDEGRGRVRGLEVSIKHEFNEGLFAWLAYTLSRAERRDSGSNEYRLFDFDQTHILTAVASYRLPLNWEVSTRFRYVTGNAYTPFKYGVFDSDTDEYVGVTGAPNSARADAFHQLDLRVDKRWIYDGWILGAYLDLQNVYNRKNVDEVDHNYDFTTSSGDAGLPILPVLGLRGEF